MTAELKQLHSPDILNLESFAPEKNYDFTFLLEITVGIKGEDGGDIFSSIVCTPGHLIVAAERKNVLFGQGYIVMVEYSYEALLAAITDFCSKCSGSTWTEISSKLHQIGRWEFD